MARRKAATQARLNSLQEKYRLLGRRKMEQEAKPDTHKSAEEIIGGFIELSTKVAQGPMTPVVKKSRAH